MREVITMNEEDLNDITNFYKACNQDLKFIKVGYDRLPTNIKQAFSFKDYVFYITKKHEFAVLEDEENE